MSGGARILALAAVVAAVASHPAAIAADERGKRLFEECAACHAAQATKGADEVGPALAGVLGRKAGTRDDFRYSAPMRRSGIVWTRATLDGYLADPQSVVPGTRMPYAGMPDAADRQALIDYLQRELK